MNYPHALLWGRGQSQLPIYTIPHEIIEPLTLGMSKVTLNVH